MRATPVIVPAGEWTLRVFVVLILGALFLALWTLRDALLLVFLAVIVAIVLQVPVQRLERMGLSRGLSLLVTLIGLVVGLVVVTLLIVSTFLVQINALSDELPRAFDDARAEYDEQAAQYDWLPSIDWDNLTESDAADFVVDQAGNLSRNVFPFLSGVGGVLANTLFVIIIALFFVSDPTNYLEVLLTMVPRGYRPRALEISVQLGNTLRRWFIGQLISMTMMGLLITLLTGVVLGLPNPVALGVIAGVMEFIPNFGSVISVIPALLVALSEDPARAVWVIPAYLVVQQVQSNAIMPRIMSRQIAIPSAMILIAQIIAGALFGFTGVVLALPLAIVVMVLVREIYIFDLINARPAQIETHYRPDGTTFLAVTAEPYRPEQLSPGEAARLLAAGYNPFEHSDRQIVEIVTPPSPALEQAARGQQAVWLAILALTVAQGLALVRSLLVRDERA